MPKVSKRQRRSATATTAGSLTFSNAATAGGGGGRHHHDPNNNNKPYSKHNNNNSNSNNNLMTPNTHLGQHFLKNPAVVASIVQKAGITPTDTVLEIGPGTGNLTLPLLERAAKVVALEYDPRMIREVLKRVEDTPSYSHKLQIIQGDAIATAWPAKFDLLVANLPYQISSPVLFKLLALPVAAGNGNGNNGNHGNNNGSHHHFRCAILLLQEEFALRLTAQPGEALYGRLSVNTQLLATVDQLLRVGKHNFRPPPKVESRVVRIALKRPRPAVNFVEWDGMIRLLFNRKNKTLRAVLNTKSVLKLLEQNRKTLQALTMTKNTTTTGSNNNNTHSKDDERSVQDIVLDIVEREPWKGQRASKMSLDDFLQLLTEFNQAGIHFS